jgi:DNA-binding PadR family transcriptional regulator
VLDARSGYEVSKRIGEWVGRPAERRRRFYKPTGEGRCVLACQRKAWAAFVQAVRRVTGDEYA